VNHFLGSSYAFLKSSYSVYAASRHSLAKFDIMTNVACPPLVSQSQHLFYSFPCFDSRPVTWASSDLPGDLAETIGIFIHFVF
jgi:hypothetical protein